MAAVPLFRDINMTAATSRENALYIIHLVLFSTDFEGRISHIMTHYDGHSSQKASLKILEKTSSMMFRKAELTNSNREQITGVAEALQISHNCLYAGCQKWVQFLNYLRP